MSSDKDFSGPPDYSVSHDKTVDLVTSGTYEAGALNLQVWKTRLAAAPSTPPRSAPASPTRLRPPSSPSTSTTRSTPSSSSSTGPRNSSPPRRPTTPRSNRSAASSSPDVRCRCVPGWGARLLRRARRAGRLRSRGQRRREGCPGRAERRGQDDCAPALHGRRRPHRRERLGARPRPCCDNPCAARTLRRRVGTVYQQIHLVGPIRVVHNVNAGRLGSWSRRRALRSLVRPVEIDVARSAPTGAWAPRALPGYWGSTDAFVGA